MYKKVIESKLKRAISILLIMALAFSVSIVKPEEVEAAAQVSVHDPSIVKAGDTYYIFGSHMAWAKSKDLKNWQTFTMNINTNYSNMYGTVWNNWCGYNASGNKISISDKDNGLHANLWAPDVIWNETMQKWCMYMSNNGKDTSHNSVITLATADQIEGPYTYAGEVVYSGFTNKGVQLFSKTDYKKVTGDTSVNSRYLNANGTWNSNYGPNCIDPCVKYDDNGELWMTYGSWFGGIYAIKLDAKTGLRDYSKTYTTVANKSDEYFGIKLAGGYGRSGEGPYFVKNGDYWYLFLSYGGLKAAGGYHMRVFRSKNLTGPYVDQNGKSAIYTSGGDNVSGDVGYKLLGNYQWSEMSSGEVAQGHNSAFVDTDGKMYVVYHTRYNNGTEWHNVRTHQLYINADGWPVTAVNDYQGETISKTGYSKEEMVGTYRVLYHKLNIDYSNLECATEQEICLNADGTITGTYNGTWTYTAGKAYVTLKIAGTEYKGVFAKGAIAENSSPVMTFTASGRNVAIWGKKVPDAKLSATYSFDGTLGSGSTIGSKVTEAAQSSTPTYVEGIHGKAVHFSGEKADGIKPGSDGIKLGTLPNRDSYSISFWFKAEASMQYTPMVFIADSVAEGNSKWISIATQGSQTSYVNGPMVWSRNDRTDAWHELLPTTEGELRLNQWQNVVLSVSNGGGFLYLDGKLIGTGSVMTGLGSNATIYLGVNEWDTPFKGAIDEVKIYEGVLNQTQVTDIVEEYKPSVNNENATLVSSYTFDGNIGNGITTGSKISAKAKSAKPTYVAGKNGKAVYFNGTGSDGIKLGKFPTFGKYSISFWFKAETSTRYTPMVFLAKDTSSSKGKWMTIATQGSQDNLSKGPMVWSRDAAANKWYDFTPSFQNSVSLNKWQHFVLTVDNDRATMYIDGSQIGTGTVPTFVDQNTYMYLGVNEWDTPFKGAIDELCIYKGVMSQSQVLQLAAGNVAVKDYNTNNNSGTTTTPPQKPSVVVPKATGITTKAAGYLGKTITLKKGKKVTIQATVKPAKAKQGVTYKSSKPSVAKVNSKGVVTAKKAGTAYITIKSKDGAKSVKYKIKVVKKNKTVKSFTLKKKSVSVKKGKTVTLALKKITSGGTSKFTYKSMNKKIAKVNKYGVITGVKKGSTKIRVKCGSKTVYVKVKVNK